MSIKRPKPRTSGTPIYVIAGFLGSGKTTLLKRALAYELDQGVKPAVLMNEFGEVDVDGALLHEHPRSHDVELQSLLSGCICCDLSGEFTEKVGHLMKETKGAPLFIETTGLADTGQVVVGVENALAEHRDKGMLVSVIVMVDAPRFLALGAYWPAAEDHLTQADTVVLNKLDQIDGRQADLVERRIRSANPAARIVRAVHADVPIDRLLEVPEEGRTATVANGAVKDSAAGYQSGSFKILRPVDPNRLEDWLRRFQRSVVRLKGFVKVSGRDGWQELQWVMGALAITPYQGARQSHAQIVVIGRRVPWERFLKGLEECLVRPPRQTKRWSRTRRNRPA
jgi:G3E family GTPase